MRIRHGLGFIALALGGACLYLLWRNHLNILETVPDGEIALLLVLAGLLLLMPWPRRRAGRP